MELNTYAKSSQPRYCKIINKNLERAPILVLKLISLRTGSREDQLVPHLANGDLLVIPNLA